MMGIRRDYLAPLPPRAHPLNFPLLSQTHGCLWTPPCVRPCWLASPLQDQINCWHKPVFISDITPRPWDQAIVLFQYWNARQRVGLHLEEKSRLQNKSERPANCFPSNEQLCFIETCKLFSSHILQMPWHRLFENTTKLLWHKWAGALHSWTYGTVLCFSISRLLWGELVEIGQNALKARACCKYLKCESIFQSGYFRNRVAKAGTKLHRHGISPFLEKLLRQAWLWSLLVQGPWIANCDLVSP